MLITSDRTKGSHNSYGDGGPEGGRNSLKEKIHFIEIAFGSMTESLSLLQNAQDLGYITEGDVEAVRPQNNHVAALLSLLKRSYEEQLNH